MRLNHLKPIRKVAAPCRCCGREFFVVGKRNGRRPEFCSDSCRQAEFRYARYPSSRTPKNAENIPANSVACRGENRGRAFPIDLVGGGFRWPGATVLDPELRRQILDVELGARR
jgi:hypothetical protein